MEANIFITLIDYLASFFISIYNIVKNLGISLVEIILIICAIFFGIRILITVLKRLSFISRLRKLFKQKGMTYEKRHSPLASFLVRHKEEDFSFEANGRHYFVKIFPGFTRGYRVHFDPNGEKVVLRRFFWHKTYHLTYEQALHGDNEYVLLFSPAPKGFFETTVSSFGKDEFPLDEGSLYDGAIFFSQGGFLRQLDRILDGYVDSFNFQNQKNDDE